ncbi:protein kinase domain-containing protein [Nonomuraea sp. ZG12]|uniref:serine/threonine-protein kinase n=1 Tax=Nonomuraea sp. ZG12 TaxID=3452207 RepID=UPI003F8A97C6
MEWEAPGYTEVKQIGAGVSGRVVLAVHDETGIKVAIKYLSQRWRHDPVALARFRSEARLLTTLRDPNVATLWEYIQDQHGAAIVMELVNGVSLRALLRENGTTGPEAALVVLKGSLLGLAKAHSLGLVHRDYKPENVIVREDGASKLVDFGIAVREGTISQPEGTPPYMAPELWSGQPSTAATDVYAATAVFFECLTGHRPYRSTEPTVLGYQHVHVPVPAHDAPEPVRELILHGMAKDPAARPASAEAFLAKLEATARAAYGEDWEERGRRRLGALVVLLGLLLPVPQTSPPAQVTTSLAQTVFRSGRGGAVKAAKGATRGVRGGAVKLAMGTTLAALVAATVIIVMANRDRPTPFNPVAAAPSESRPPAGLSSPPSAAPSRTTAETPAAVPQVGPQQLITDSPSLGQPPASDSLSPTTTTGPPPASTPPSTSTPTSRSTPSSPPTATSTRSTPPNSGPPTGTPTTPRVTTPPATTPRVTTPPVTTPPVTTPRVTTPPVTTPPVTTRPVTAVSRLTVDRFTVDRAVAGGTYTVGATGTAPIVLTAAWRVGGETVHNERVRLSGATSYTGSLRHVLREPPCGERVTFTVSTTPAAPGGASSSTVSVPECPTRVTGLRVGLRMDAASGVARAQVTMTTSGTAAVPVTAAFAVNRDQVGTREATLSGRTSYRQSFTHTFRSRPCGAVVTVRVRAGGRTATGRAEVTCPAEVKRVSISRAVLDGNTATASIAVTTGNTRPVRVNVVFALDGRIVGAKAVTLSGETSYLTTVSHAYGEVPCGASWRVRAGTRPAAGNGGDSAGGRTPACPQPEEPTKSPRPESSDTGETIN